MEAAHQVLQEQLEGLRQTQHRLAVDHEGRDLLAAVLHDLAVIGGGVIGRDHGGRGPSTRGVNETT